MKKLLISLIIILATNQFSFAFDGKRKGFVIGGGIGFSPVMMNDYDIKDDGSKAIASGQSHTLFLGYSGKSDLFAYGGSVSQGESQNLNDRLFRDIFTGLWWYHYFKINDKNFNSIVGLGAAYYTMQSKSDFDQSFGFQLGLGYEIVPHVQLNLVFSEGKFSYGESYNYYHLTLQLHAIAY